MANNNQLQTRNKNEVTLNGNVFNGIEEFEAAQRMAKALMSSGMVPDAFKNDMGANLIALDMASRLKMNVLSVMQNMYIVHGKPAWSSQFVISAINQSGLFGSSLHFEFVGKPGTDSYGCKAWVYEKETRDKLEGTTITIDMAKAEGWYSKNGSKWKTMPEQMLRYRAASFFGRAYAPDVLMGLHTKEEIEDIPSEDYSIVETDYEVEKEKGEKANSLDLGVEDVEEIKEETKEPKNIDEEAGEVIEDDNIEGQSDFFGDDFEPVENAPF